ncbi:MAG: polyisoprenoid-binding protein [Magnetospirillum sp.]|nr:MAG: polyisoprenoid-binding protein [Magnetospirillum sp.]
MTSATAALAIAVAFAFAAAPPASAQSAASTDLAKIEGGHFAVDKSHAKLIFSFSHFGFSTSYGLFSDFDAKIAFDPKAPATSALDVTVNMDHIDTFVPKLDAHMKSADMFDVAKFPTATFKSTAIEVTGPTTGKVTGSLTLHGVTKPVTLDTTFNGGGINPASKNYVIGFNATARLKRTDFGVGYAAPVVGDEVTLTISGEFIRQP